jgi:hypothetical protein
MTTTQANAIFRTSVPTMTVPLFGAPVSTAITSPFGVAACTTTASPLGTLTSPSSGGHGSSFSNTSLFGNDQLNYGVKLPVARRRR